MPDHDYDAEMCEDKTEAIAPLRWTNENPTTPGDYVFVRSGQWPKHVVDVRLGRWQSAQNPDILYANGEPVRDMQGRWFGPIPDFKQKRTMKPSECCDA